MRAIVLAVFVALAAGCGDESGLSEPACPADPAWADYVVWDSPAEDCAAACGTYFASLKVPSLAEPAAICVFRLPGGGQ